MNQPEIQITSNPIGQSVWVGIGNSVALFPQLPHISDFGLLQRIHPGHALTYMRTDRDEAGKRIGRVLGWEDGKMVAIREDGAAVEIHGS